MTNPFRQQVRIRKLVYVGLIVALFTGSLVFRRWVIEPEAMRLQLREQARGEVELTSSAAQLTLLGSKGIASTVLWYVATKKQMKHEWNELELVVKSISKLQPHALGAWRFMGWNLSFNVSVECDRARDKYFYISRGLELLAEGDRRNQGTREAGELHFPGSPELRFDLGFFYQLKIGNSDEKQYMRCLLDLSCIDPARRDPARFWAVDDRGRTVVNQAELESFCRSFPRLVRRLREHLGRARPADVIAFLEDNREVPSRFEAPTPGAASPETPLKKAREQFPVLPHPVPLLANLPDPMQREFPFSFDVYQAAKAWFLFAQEPLPPVDPEAAVHGEQPVDQTHYRLPKVSVVLFRGYPSRASFYAAEQLEKEGWFDEEEGWTIRDWFDSRPGGPKRVVTVGTESKYHAGDAWQRALDALRDYAQQNGLLYTPSELRSLQQHAQVYQERQKQAHAAGSSTPLTGQRGSAESADAYKRLRWYEYHRGLVNSEGFLTQAAVEATPNCVAARKLLFQAARLEAQTEWPKALSKYEQALARWEDVLLAHPAFRRIEEIQRETYETESKYLDLRQKQQGDWLVQMIVAVLQFGNARPDQTPVVSLPLIQLSPAQENALLPLPRFEGPFELLYVYELPDMDPQDLAVSDWLLALTQVTGWAPPAVSEYQKNRMLVVRSTAEMPVGGQVGRWRPLLGEEALAEIRKASSRRQPHRGRPGAAPGGR